MVFKEPCCHNRVTLSSAVLPRSSCWVHLEYEAEVVEPLCVLEGGVPFGAGHGETERPQ